MRKKKILALIPARLKSKRLPNKVILPIGGMPIVMNVYNRALRSKRVNDVMICCDDKKIMNIVKSYGAKSIITSKKHINGTERICEKVIDFHFKNFNADIVVPNLLIKNKKNKNLVKVVTNFDNDILYLSRLEVPHGYISKNDKLLKHLSIVSFKPKSLLKFAKLKKSKLEKLENIELLRALEYGMKLKTFSLTGDSFSVDVRKDYKKAKKYIKKDKLFKLYK